MSNYTRKKKRPQLRSFIGVSTVSVFFSRDNGYLPTAEFFHKGLMAFTALLLNAFFEPFNGTQLGPN